jgi:hypothetical protein
MHLVLKMVAFIPVASNWKRVTGSVPFAHCLLVLALVTDALLLALAYIFR